MTTPATSRHRGLTEQAAQTAVDASCRMLRLPTIRKNYEETAERAAREQMSYLGFLADLLPGFDIIQRPGGSNLGSEESRNRVVVQGRLRIRSAA